MFATTNRSNKDRWSERLSRFRTWEEMEFALMKDSGVRTSNYIQRENTNSRRGNSVARAKKVANDTRIIFSFSENSWWQNHAENNICICPTRQKKNVWIRYPIPSETNKFESLARTDKYDREDRYKHFECLRSIMIPKSWGTTIHLLAQLRSATKIGRYLSKQPRTYPSFRAVKRDVT